MQGRSRGAACCACPTIKVRLRLSCPKQDAALSPSWARRHDLMILENAVYRPLVPDAPPPISAFAPERSFVFSSFSKIIALGFAPAFLVAPPAEPAI